MTITTRDQLIDAMGNNSSRIVFDKASIASQVANTFCSMWRATGQPGQGAIPVAAAVCNDNLLGCIPFNQQTSPNTSYLSILEAVSSNSAMTLEIHDRLMHMGGLNGTLTTAQTVGLDLLPNLAIDDLDARKGDANYSDVQWWLEWYTATGATASNATINVTYDDGSTGNLTVVAVGGTRPASHAIPLNGLIPAANSGRYIRAINNVTLSASTAVAGNFGFTATRYRAALPILLANLRWTADWAALGLPRIENNACLFAMLLTSTTTSGTLRATGKISHG
jgi:hypothetical protein